MVEAAGCAKDGQVRIAPRLRKMCIRDRLQAGFTAVEPLPPPPPEPSPDYRVLPYFIAAGLACLVIGAVIPPEDGGMAWGLAGLVVTGIVGARVLKKEKVRVHAEGAKFKAYLLHESYFTLCRKSVSLVLALSLIHI